MDPRPPVTDAERAEMADRRLVQACWGSGVSATSPLGDHVHAFAHREVLARQTSHQLRAWLLEFPRQMREALRLSGVSDETIDHAFRHVNPWLLAPTAKNCKKRQ